MQNLGIVKPGSKLVLNFDTFDGGTGAPITMTGFTVADVEIYKDVDFVTQRASDSGYALLDDGIDVDAITGVHALSVDLADNSTAGFWACGSHYAIRIGPVTIDAQTVNFWLAEFTIGVEGAFLDTTIATLSTQVSFTLTKGPAEAAALIGCVMYAHDVASEVQGGFAVVTAYDVTTKTVTLLAGPTFTMVATDNVSFFPPVNNFWFGQAAQGGDGVNLTETGGDGAQLTEAGGDGDHLNEAGGTGDQLTGIPGVVTVTGNVDGSVASNVELGPSEVQAQVDAALVTVRLDELLAADSDIDGAAPPTVGSVFHELLTKTAGSFTYNQATDSLEAVRDHATTIKSETALIVADTGTDGVKIGADAIGAAQIADDAIATEHLATGAITSDTMAADSIDASALATDAVDEISDGVWDEILTGAEHNIATSAGRRLRGIQEFQGYENGAIWIDTVNGSAGTIDFENGTVENPVNTLADANTLAASLGITRFRIAPGSSLTFVAAQQGQEFVGSGWTLALGGQDIANTSIEGATVSGIGLGAGMQFFVQCTMDVTTYPADSHIIECTIAGTQTLIAGDFYYDRCHSGIAGMVAPLFDFTVGALSTNLNIRNYSGGIDLRNMGQAGTDVASIEGRGQVIVNANCTGGAASIRGLFSLTDNGTVTITDDARYNTSQVSDDWADGGRLDLLLDAILGDTGELQTDWTEGGRLDLLIDAILMDTGELQVDWVDGGRLDLLIDAIKLETDKLDAAHTEPTGVPAANESPLGKIAYLFMEARNKVTATATKKTVFGDDGVAEYEYDLSDAAGTYTESEANII